MIYGFDAEQGDTSELVYLRARYYSSYLNQFIQADPAQTGPNLHVYASDNPLVNTNPLGLFSRQEIMGALGNDNNWGAFLNCEDMSSFSNYDKPHSKWDFLAALMDANPRDRLEGYRLGIGEDFSPPYYEMVFNAQLGYGAATKHWKGGNYGK
jgi:RHS repeat-associated protein